MPYRLSVELQEVLVFQQVRTLDRYAVMATRGVIQARKLRMFGKVFVDQAGIIEHGLTPVQYEGGSSDQLDIGTLKTP